MEISRLEKEEIQEQFLDAIANGDHKLVKKLLKKGAEIDGCNFYGQYPLHIAAERGQKKCVEILISAGAKPNVLDFEKLTPLSTAVLFNHIECVKELLRLGADTNKDIENSIYK